MQNDILVEQKVINILVADDHKLLRDTWRRLFEKDFRFNIIGEAADGNEAIRLAEQLRPDIILMDINMHMLNGIEAAEAILKIWPQSRIIAVSMNMNPAVVKKILQIGLWGYVSKYSALDEFTNAILSVHNGVKYVCSETKNLLAKTYVEDGMPTPQVLTFREMTILQLVKEGFFSREIADKLGVSVKTIEVHRYHILKKMKLKNTAALVNYCSVHGV